MLDRVLDIAIKICLAVAAVAILVAVFASSFDALGTRLLNKPIPGAVEITTALMVVTTYGSLPYIQSKGGHIHVEILRGMSGRRGRRILDIVNSAIGLAFFGVLAWQGSYSMMGSWRIKETTPGILAFPIYLTKTFLLLALVIVVLCIIREFRLASVKRETINP